MLTGCVLLLWLSANPVRAAALQLQPGPERWFVATHADALVDPPGRLTLAEVQAQDSALHWQVLDTNTPSFGFTPDTVWLRLSLQSGFRQARSFVLRLEYPLMDQVDFYWQQAGRNHHVRSGDHYPFSTRTIKERNFAIPLRLEAGEQVTLYLRLQSRDTLIAPLVIYTENAYAGQQRTELLMFGMYYGAILVIVLVNGFLFFFLRQKVQAYFVAMLGTYALMELSLNGMGNVFLWQDYPEFAKLIRPLAISTLAILSVLLTKSYFNFRSFQLGRINVEPLFWLVGIVGIGGTLVLPFTWAIRVAMVAILCCAPAMAMVAVQQVIRRNPAGYYYLLGWIGLILGGVLNVLRAFDVLPVNFLTTYGSQIGSLLTLLILNMGLTEQFRQIQRLREQDYMRRLHQTAEMNRQLDQKVQERTQELQAQANAAEQARIMAEQALLVKSQFLATMSHEIRTPMNGVLGITQILADTPLNPHQRHLVSTIKNSGNALVAIINDILDFSKIEAGKLTLEHIEFSLRDLLDESLALFANPIEQKPLRLILHVEPDVPARIMGDPTRLQQILLNLIGNAIKFTHEGHIIVRARYLKPSSTLQLDVQDTGIGISEEQQRKLFQSFSQADSSTTRKYGGTGLGLVISRSLVQLMGGSIHLQSQPGSGSTFRIDLPCNVCALPELVPGLHNKIVLVADPLPAFQSALHDMLATWGCIPLTGLQPGNPLDRKPDVAIISQWLSPDEQTRWRKRLDCPQLVLLKPGSDQPRSPHHLTGPVTQELRNLLLNLFTGRDQTTPQPPDHPRYDQLQVLVAEDNPVNQMVIRGLLKKFGIQPDIANDGLEAIHAAQSSDQPYDLILMDCEMPNLDGYQSTRQLRLLPRCQHTRIVGLSAHAMAEHRQAALDAGMAAFLTKPVSVEQLERELGITLDGKTG